MCAVDAPLQIQSFHLVVDGEEDGLQAHQTPQGRHWWVRFRMCWPPALGLHGGLQVMQDAQVGLKMSERGWV